MKIGPLVTKLCHLVLGGPVIITHSVDWDTDAALQSNCW